ncbi:MAG: hypothetical protein WCY28_02770 [Candidatus Shapirobacteria bacterium]|jgi:hypothetical protein
MTKENLKNKAIQLRKNGNSYSEILKYIPVAKSTLSLWLRSVNLSKRQKQTLTLKKLQAAWRGGEAKKINRIKKSKKIIEQAKMEIGKITDRDAWLAGIMLYWAEGSKQKETNVSAPVKFSNSDPIMLSFFIMWLKKYLKVSDNELVFEMFIHENHKEKKIDFINYWSKILDYPVSKFDRIYYKRHNLKTKRKNIGENYHGQLAIMVKRSTNLNRRIIGWIEGFNQ